MFDEDKREKQKRDAAAISLILATVSSVGGGLLHYGHHLDIFMALGFSLVLWVVLLIVFVNLFSPY